LQVSQGVQLSALLLVLNEPLAQFAQERLLVGVPSFCTNCPAAHVVLSTHAVAELPS